jgi:hypothetical protein
MAAYTVREKSDERTGEYRENQAGEDRDPLQLDKNGSIVDPPPKYRQFFLNEERDLLGI